MTMHKLYVISLLCAAFAAPGAAAGPSDGAAAPQLNSSASSQGAGAAPVAAPAAAPAAGAAAAPDACLQPPDEFQDKCPNAQQNAQKYAQRLFDLAGVKFADAQQRDTMLAALTKWVRTNPSDAQGAYQLLYYKDPGMKEYVTSLTGEGPDQLAKINDMGERVKKELSRVNKKDSGGYEKAKADANQDWAGELAKGDSVDPNATVAPSGADKKALVSGDEMISGVAVSDLYSKYGERISPKYDKADKADKDYKPQDLQIDIRNDDPNKTYVHVADVSNLKNIQGADIAITHDSVQTIVLNKQAYLVKVSAVRPSDASDPKQTKELHGADYQIKIFALKKSDKDSLADAEKKADGGEFGQEDGKEIYPAGFVGGPQGLMAKRIEQVWQDAHGPSADMHMARLGKSHKLFYYTLQGGNTVSYVFYPADAVDRAHAAIEQAKNGAPSDPKKQFALDPADMRPYFTVAWAESNESGVAVPYPDGSKPLRLGADDAPPAYHFVFDPLSAAMVFKPMTKDELQAYDSAHSPDAAASGTGGGSDSGSDSGAPGPDGKPGKPGRGGNGGGGGIGHGKMVEGADSDWPFTIPSDDPEDCGKGVKEGPDKGKIVAKLISDHKCNYSVEQAGSNKGLKQISADYRVYYSTVGARSFVLVFKKDIGDLHRPNVVKKSVMLSNVLAQIPDSPDGEGFFEKGKDANAVFIGVRSKAKKFTYFFDAKSPKAVSVPDSQGTMLPAPVACANEGGCGSPGVALKVKRMSALVPTLAAAGYKDADIGAIVKKAQAANPGEKFEIDETQGIVVLTKDGGEQVILWPQNGAGGAPAVAAARAAKAANAGGAAVERVYAMDGSETNPINNAILPPQIGLGGETLTRDPLSVFRGSELNCAAVYVNAAGDKKYLAFAVYGPKPGLKISDVKSVNELVPLGTTDPKGSGLIDPEAARRMNWKPLVVLDAADMKKLNIMSDPVHPNAYAAYYGAYNKDSKFGNFIQHVAWTGDAEPSTTEDGSAHYSKGNDQSAPEANDCPFYKRYLPGDWCNKSRGGGQPAPAAQPTGTSAMDTMDKYGPKM